MIMRNQNVINYIDKQFSQLCEDIENGEYRFPIFTRVKFQNENGETNYMNLTNNQMLKIMQIMQIMKETE
jgi:hypothetical protein